MTLVSGNIRFMRILAVVPWEGASNDSGVVDGGAEFAGPENGVPKKNKDRKMQDLENDGPGHSKVLRVFAQECKRTSDFCSYVELSFFQNYYKQ